MHKHIYVINKIIINPIVKYIRIISNVKNGVLEIVLMLVVPNPFAYIEAYAELLVGIISTQTELYKYLIAFNFPFLFH